MKTLILSLILAATLPAQSIFFNTNYVASLGTVATPSFDHDTGSYVNSTAVTITDSTSGSTIVYCTAIGADCTPGTSYTMPVTISVDTTHLCANATKSGWTPSTTYCATYTITAPASIDAGIDFRATSGYVTDSSDNDYSLGAAYPDGRKTLTFGWSNATGINVRDRSTSTDHRLSGVTFIAAANTNTTCSTRGSTKYFIVNLPNGAGMYSVTLAAGDQGGVTHGNFLICDGTVATALATFGSVTVAATSFLDATGTIYTAANWVTSQTPISLTFTGTAMHLVPTSNSNPMVLAHVYLHQ